MSLFGFGRYKPVKHLHRYLAAHRVPAELHFLPNNTPFLTIEVRPNVAAQVALLGGVQWGVEFIETYAEWPLRSQLQMVAPVGVEFDQLMRQIVAMAPSGFDPNSRESKLGRCLTRLHPEVEWKLVPSPWVEGEPVLLVLLDESTYVSVSSAGSATWGVVYFSRDSDERISDGSAGPVNSVSYEYVVETVLAVTPSRRPNPAETAPSPAVFALGLHHRIPRSEC